MCGNLTQSFENVTGNVVSCHLELYYALVLLQGLQQGPPTQQTDVVPPQVWKRKSELSLVTQQRCLVYTNISTTSGEVQQQQTQQVMDSWDIERWVNMSVALRLVRTDVVSSTSPSSCRVLLRLRASAISEAPWWLIWLLRRSRCVRVMLDANPSQNSEKDSSHTPKAFHSNTSLRTVFTLGHYYHIINVFPSSGCRDFIFTLKTVETLGTSAVTRFSKGHHFVHISSYITTFYTD